MADKPGLRAMRQRWGSSAKRRWLAALAGERAALADWHSPSGGANVWWECHEWVGGAGREFVARVLRREGVEIMGAADDG